MLYSLKQIIKKFTPIFIIDWYHLSLAYSGALIYGFPSRDLKVIGITGTNGKSTVVQLASEILEKSGFKTASISSVRFKIGDKEWKNELKMTMPGRFKIQQFLRQAVKDGCKYAVLEVTSEGIKQYRHRFIDFNMAVLTNITPEHIESHGGFENYKKAKLELFRGLKNGAISVVNLDDPSAGEFSKYGTYKYGYEINNKKGNNLDSRLRGNDRMLKAENIKLYTDRSSFVIGNSLFSIPLIGQFNVYNALAAICVGLSQNISIEKMRDILESAKGVPGRMEIVVNESFTVIVDYAHTPDALEKVYKTLYSLKNNNAKIIGVLGAAGGGRDKWKRPEMGKLAAKYCDIIILTNEDPYDENPFSILEDIEKGFSSSTINNLQLTINYEKILDRKEAIKKALSLAQAGDIVIITGKGSEPWMCVAGGRKIPWDDRQIVREEMAKLNH